DPSGGPRGAHELVDRAAVDPQRAQAREERTLRAAPLRPWPLALAILLLPTLSAPALGRALAPARDSTRHRYTPRERHDAGETILRTAIAAHGLTDNHVCSGCVRYWW